MPNTPREYSLAVLMAEDEDHHREPIGIVTTRAEAEELASADMRKRFKRLERGDDPGICPIQYQIWEHRRDGYEIAEEWPV